MNPEQQQEPKADWEKFMADDDRREADQRAEVMAHEFSDNLVPVSDEGEGARHVEASAEMSKLEGLYTLFRKLPDESQTHVIDRLNAGLAQNEDPEKLIAHALALIEAHNDFTQADEIPQPGNVNEKDKTVARRAIEELLRKLRNIREQKEPGALQAPADESSGSELSEHEIPKSESGNRWVN